MNRLNTTVELKSSSTRRLFQTLTMRLQKKEEKIYYIEIM